MGVRGLWTILNPYCERKSLYELNGKVVAIDLAGWVCEALTVVEYSVQPRFYLRNLYFRTCYLLFMDVRPIFVLEGKAPTLKYDTIAQRNAIQFKGARPNKGKPKTSKDRTRFNSILKQCEEFLKLMGLTCIQGWGEAEAMCAYLNANDLVDGCISQDSDCFVYGAKVVYRNFSVSQQGHAAASGGAVDIYDIRNIPKSLDFGKNKMVALALLCGCDYNGDGVSGVGKDSVMKFLNVIKDSEIINRMKNWRDDIEKYERLEQDINNPNICTSCGHVGKVQKHSRSGCLQCKQIKGCGSKDYKEWRITIKNELGIRSKALCDFEFPNQQLIDEFLIEKGPLPDLDLSWHQPNLIGFVKYTRKMLDWEEIYAFEKFLPIFTRWQLLNIKNLPKLQNFAELYPDFIKKTRTPKGIPSYEIIWCDRQNYYSGLVPDCQLKQLETNSKEQNIQHILWSTIEPQHLVQKAYPDLVETFLESKKTKKKPTKRRKNDCDLEISFSKLCIAKKKKEIRAVKQKICNEKVDTRTISKAKTINNFFTKVCEKTVETETCVPNKMITETPIKSYSQYFTNDFNCSDILLVDDEDDLDVSDIVSNIVTKDHINDNSTIVKNICGMQVVTGRTNSMDGDLETSYFFETMNNEQDVFEKTFNGNFSFSGTNTSDDDSESR